jgi:hypothetical protein
MLSIDDAGGSVRGCAGQRRTVLILQGGEHCIAIRKSSAILCGRSFGAKVESQRHRSCQLPTSERNDRRSIRAVGRGVPACCICVSCGVCCRCQNPDAGT